MNAQFLYDFREEWEFCSGTELSEFFVKELAICYNFVIPNY